MVLETHITLAHLAGMPFRFPLVREDRWWTAAQTFADEYFALVPNAWRDRLPVHYAGAAILKGAVGFFGRQEPGWSERSQSW